MAEQTPGPDGRMYRKCLQCGRPHFTVRNRFTHPETKGAAFNGIAWGGVAGLVAGILVNRVLSADVTITWSRLLVIGGILAFLFALAGFLLFTGAAKPTGDWCRGSHGA